jgi:peptidoglycan/xylan/chitin deacetylase (PgdA/CDA1 family)
MCNFCLSRRALLMAPACLPFAEARATTAIDAVIEPRMRLASPTPNGLTVALTFDACPGAFDDRIAHALVEQDIPASIFVTDLWMRRNPDALAFLLAHPDLFAMQNHGERHIPPVLGERRIFGIQVAGDLATVRREVGAGADAVGRASGAVPRWYRAATGFYSPSSLDAIKQHGIGIGGYSLNADMGASLPAAAVAARIGRATDGDVIVAHINQPHRPSGEGVVAGIRSLQRRGAVFRRFRLR